MKLSMLPAFASIKRLQGLLVISIGLLATACGGGGGGGSAPAAQPAQAVTNQSAEGFWSGTITSTPINTTYNVVGVVAPNGEMRFVSTTSGAQYIGTSSVTGNAVSANVLGVGPAGWVFLNGQPTTTGTVSGTVTSKASMSGTYTAQNDSGSFTLTYDPIYDRPSSLPLVAKTWSGSIFGNLGTATVTMTADAAGVITGTDNLGCVYNGTVSIVNPAKNLYQVALTQSVCGPNTTFNGLAVLSDSGLTQNNVLNFHMNSATSTWYGQLM